MAKIDQSSERADRLRPTTLDGLVAGLSPVLIIGMICCLVFFLVIVVYQGAYQQRLMYILGLYTFAIVLVARIAIEQSRAVAFGYTMLLGGATLFVSLRFVTFQGVLAPFSLPIVAGFLVLIGFLADRITFDCTLIDEAKEESGVGLLQSLGILANPKGSEAKSTPTTLDEKGTSLKPKKKHNPGIWVLYFAWMAIPLFGLGQMAIPGDDESSRRLAFFFLFGYLFFALSLLVVTAFLSMRRYLRRRGVAMPARLNFVWIVGGMAGALALLFLTSLLPLPSGSMGMLDLPIKIESPDNLPSSRHGWGNEGVPTESEQNQKQIDEKTKSEATVEGDGTSKNKKAASDGKTTTKGKSKDKSNASKNDSHASSEKSDSKSPGDDDEKSPSEPPAEPNANEPPENDPSQAKDAKAKADSERKNDRQEPPPKQEQADAPKPPPPPPSAKPGWSISLSGGLANLLRWLVILALIGFMVFWLIRYRDQFAAMLRDFAAWWQSLFGIRADVANELDSTSLDEVNTTPRRLSFRDLSDPFTSRGQPDAARIIKQVFEAVEIWGRDHRLNRADRETPQEFLQRMTQNYPEQKERLQHLAQLYNRLAYAGGRAQPEEVKPLRDLWSWLAKTSVCLVLSVACPTPAAFADEGRPADLSFAIRSFDTVGNRAAKKNLDSNIERRRKELGTSVKKQLGDVVAQVPWTNQQASDLYADLCRLHWIGNGIPAEIRLLPPNATAPIKFDIRQRVPQPLAEIGWPAGYTTVQTPHFRVSTQGSGQLGVEVAKLCEQTYAVWQQLFFPAWSDADGLKQAVIARQPPALPQGEHRFQVILFRDRESYLKQLARTEANVAVSTGYYSPSARMVFCYWDAANSEATLRHELTHQFFTEGSRWSAANPTNAASDFWIVEGLALFMESLRIERYETHDEAILGGWDAWRLQPARYRRLHDQTWVPWDEFRAAGNERFRTGDDIKIWYSQAAGLSHLWMESSEARRTQLIEYAETVLRGAPKPSMLQDWNRDETLRSAYDRFLMSPTEGSTWRPTSAKTRDIVLSRCEVSSSTLSAWPEENRKLDWLDLSFTSVDDRLFLETGEKGSAAWDVRRLNLESTKITGASLSAIASMSRLEELDLSNCKLKDVDLQLLRSHRTLKTLWLTGNAELTDATVEILISLPKLEQVDIEGTSISQAGRQKLQRKLPRLRKKP